MYDQNIFGPARGNFSDCYCLLGAVRQLGYKTVRTLRFERLLNFVFTQPAVQHTRRNLHQQFGRTRTRNSMHGQVPYVSLIVVLHFWHSVSVGNFPAFCECRKFSGIL